MDLFFKSPDRSRSIEPY